MSKENKKDHENYCVTCEGGFRTILGGPDVGYWVTDERCKKCGRVMQVDQ